MPRGKHPDKRYILSVRITFDIFHNVYRILRESGYDARQETRVSHEGKVNAPNLWPRKDQVSIDAGNGAGYPAPAKDPQSPHMKVFWYSSIR